jgi:transketolase
MPTRRELANCIRALAMDAVQKANSGHPGMPMGMADIAEVLWHDFLHHNPSNPRWANRDRFVLSNGHGCMLQYAVLHLTGYDLSLDDLKHFRQLHSKTPGHPEYGYTPGVESTTGPLGQGLGHAAGIALAEKILGQLFNQKNFNIIDHYTYVFLGDGCLMEGISHEVCSLASTWKLNKLIAFWDNNHISIDGQVGPWFTDNTPERFRAYGWHVIENIDGHDADQIKQAIITAKSILDKPVLICCKTIIGFGAPTKANTADAHGSPLGDAEITAAKAALHWTYPAFDIPVEYYAAWSTQEKGQHLENQWQNLFADYQKQFPELAKELMRRLEGNLPENFEAFIKQAILDINPENIASRKASQNYINLLTPFLPELLGGSADLTHSNLTLAKTAKIFTADNPTGTYIHYGVREFGMSAIMCGIALHGGFIPFGGTFLTFCDYARNAVRLSALMKIHVIYIYSHDSIGLGEDGPTHQPIEHLNMLRMTPGLSIWRPCDDVETLIAWQMAIEQKNHPTCLILSRQNLPSQIHNNSEDIKYGAYILYQSNSNKTPDVILISTGSEVSIAMDAAKMLESKHHKNIRVISMPSVDMFLKQDQTYQEKLLPKEVKNRIAIEAGSKDSWYRFVGLDGKVVGLERFGESAPASEVYQYLGITVDNIVKTALL